MPRACSKCHIGVRTADVGVVCSAVGVVVGVGVKIRPGVVRVVCCWLDEMPQASSKCQIWVGTAVVGMVGAQGIGQGF